MSQRSTYTAKSEQASKFDPGLQVARPKPSTVGTLAVSSVPLGDRVQAAQYVGALTAELAVLVRRHQLHTLGYLLELARLESEEIAQQHEGAPSPPGSKASPPSGQRNEGPAVPLDAAGKFELQDDGSHDGGTKT